MAYHGTVVVKKFVFASSHADGYSKIKAIAWGGGGGDGVVKSYRPTRSPVF